MSELTLLSFKYAILHLKNEKQHLTDKMYLFVDGKQLIGHRVPKVVVKELEKEMLHVFKKLTLDWYQ